MSKKKIILIGGGGHCKSVIDVIELEDKFQIEGIVDIKEKFGSEVTGYKIKWNDDDLLELVKQGYEFCITVGQLRSAQIRTRVYNNIKSLGGKFATIISPMAYVSKNAQVSEGTVVMHHAMVNAGAKIGFNCILNTKCLIEHDTVIGNNCHVSTAAVLNGEVMLGDEVFVGSNSVVANNIRIASKVVIGAGSTVIKNIESAGTYVGVPASRK